MQTMNQPQLGASRKALQETYPIQDQYSSNYLAFERAADPLPTLQYRPSQNWIHPTDRAAQTDCLLQTDSYSIHLVSTLKQRIKASTLIKRMYASRGYQTDSASVFSAIPFQYTFEARCGQRIIGTLTLTIDSNNGLLADTLYQSELDQFREQGHKPCEVSKLAFAPNSSSKEIFAALFHIAYLYAHVLHDAQDAFIEINPRHMSFYRRMLGFCQIGQQQTCPRVNAPAVLLHLDLEYMGAQITAMAGQLRQREKSIYPLFLTRSEEEGVIQRMQPEKTITHTQRKCNTDTRLSLART
ncbi:N-acyl amino acid synthase FeeM domain-containing protein [Nitrosomonas sp. ANs5]|uniref:N-acyl amino acid synthase FeeM domain-containing protein n=1 Tax=Nitrosomonas sp. ANs5 TaxID=3423941 RepID=UPI003D340E9B